MKVVKINRTNVDAYETLYVEIIEKKLKFILDVVYRPLKLSEENYKKFYEKIKAFNKDKNAVICEDFNNHSVNWSTLTSN